MSTGNERDPDPGLESLIAAGVRGELREASVLELFTRWPLFVPSGADFFGAPEKFQPVIFETPDGPMMAIYTAPDRMSRVAELAPYWTRLAGLAILAQAAPGVGFVVNPASDVTMEIPPGAVPRLHADFSAERPVPPMAAGRELSAFEQSVIDLALGRVDDEVVIAALADSELFVPTSTVVEADFSELSPVTFERKGITYLGAYSAADFVRPPVSDDVPYAIGVPAASAFLSAVGGPFGVVINPGTAFEYFTEPEVVETF